MLAGLIHKHDLPSAYPLNSPRSLPSRFTVQGKLVKGSRVVGKFCDSPQWNSLICISPRPPAGAE